MKTFIDGLLWDREANPERELYRLKGVLSIKGSDKRHVLQAVYEQYNITETSDWASDELRR